MIVSGDWNTVSAKLAADSTLAAEFEEYRQENGMTSKSEAVRHLLRAGLEQEMPTQTDDKAADSMASGESATEPDISLNLISGNEPILFGLAFIIGSEGFLTVTQSVAGGFWGSIIYVATGIVIFATMMPMFLRALSHLIRASVAADGQDPDADSSGAQG